jgi:hypothetical protein
VSVSMGGEKVMLSGMGSEPPEAVCSVISGWAAEFQYKSDTCRKTSKSFKAERSRRPTHCPSNSICQQGPPSHIAPRISADRARRWLLSIWPRRGADPICCASYNLFNGLTSRSLPKSFRDSLTSRGLVLRDSNEGGPRPPTSYVRIWREERLLWPRRAKT